MRLVLFVTPLLCLAACGSVCDHIGSSEQQLLQRGQACNPNWTAHDVNTCNSGLNSCTPNDTQAMGNYIQCLDNIGTCSSSSSLSWNLSVLGCGQPLGQISLSCRGATGL
jgi:hypothetical protein